MRRSQRSNIRGLRNCRNRTRRSRRNYHRSSLRRRSRPNRRGCKGPSWGPGCKSKSSGSSNCRGSLRQGPNRTKSKGWTRNSWRRKNGSSRESGLPSRRSRIRSNKLKFNIKTDQTCPGSGSRSFSCRRGLKENK